jgi:capsular polysaccharide export protein
MKIGIAPFAANFLEFFVNLAAYLEKQGDDIIFINPDKYLRKKLLDYGFDVAFYDRVKIQENYFDADSALVKYQTRLYRIKDTQGFIKKKNTEYSKSKQFLLANTFDSVLFWNGKGNVESYVCKEIGQKCFFFENGYFPDTLQMNRAGVNCEAEFAQLNEDDFLKFVFQHRDICPRTDFNIISVKQKFISRIFYRFLDASYRSYFLEYLKHTFQLSKAKKRFKKQLPDNLSELPRAGYIFFPLQVNSDTQIILNSPYKSMYETLSLVLPELLKTGSKIIIKEHPYEVEPVCYKEFVDRKDVFLCSKTDIDNLIKESVYVVCVNSSVGLQALAQNKPVLILGESIYDFCPGAVKYNGEQSITHIEKVSKTGIDNSKSLKHFSEKIFIDGNWNSISLTMLHSIAQRIR